MNSSVWCLSLLLTFFVAMGETFACEATVTGLVFGRYEGIGNQPATGVGFLQLNCPWPALVRLSAGLHSQGTFNSRFLASTSGSDHLRYNLFLDPTAIRVWGDGAANTFVESVPSGISNLQIYAVIPGGQRVGIGNYTDMITVIIDW